MANAPPSGSNHPPPGANGDADWMRRLTEGDATALDPLYRRHRGAVYRFAVLWTGSTALGADVTQDVFMHLLTRASDFAAERGALLPWLLGIARNFCRQRTGALHDSVALDTYDDPPTPALTTTHTPLDSLIGRQDLDRLRRAIASLPPHYRDVLVLTELAERSYVETALICGCELNTVRSRLSRARALLARWLEGPDVIEGAT